MAWNSNKLNQKRTDAYKTIVVGDCDVGKTSIIRRYLHNQFTTTTDSTIGASFSCTRREEEDRYKKIDIWDTAGQERFRSIISIYYRGADACLMVCDLTKKDSIQNLKYWIYDLLERTDNNDIYVILVGNKIDLMEKEFKVPLLMQELSEKYNYPIILTSALDGTNVEKIFDMILDKMDIPFCQRKDKCCENLQQISKPKLEKHSILNNISGWCNVL